MDPIVIREIESQLSLDADLLFRMLGAQNSVGATPGTSRDGKVIIENVKRTLRERICADRNVREVHAGTGKSRVLLVAAIIDCVAGAVTGVSPVTVSVLLVKEGLETICKQEWASGT